MTHQQKACAGGGAKQQQVEELRQDELDVRQRRQSTDCHGEKSRSRFVTTQTLHPDNVRGGG
jgi:hypothetical protein